MVENKIVDTNVPLTAVDSKISLICQKACVQLVEAVLNEEVRVVIDTSNEVVQEYRHNMYPDPNPAAGLASQFLMYILTNQYTDTRVSRVEITKDKKGNYEDFPSDARLAEFDPSDYKWVALSVAYSKETGETAPIVNATDSDWLHFEDVFNDLAIDLEFLCREVLKPK